ncbi:hypothetical protein PV11_07865 [Exophiala sideris]|uniref:Secreted protein n=1 Tax=Exophiala sideris TaxID=1016849 RepID=A0A0D1YHB4_9EURO|nr:hypothetical protein PV11_07865 [Exophiala sideris]
MIEMLCRCMTWISLVHVVPPHHCLATEVMSPRAVHTVEKSLHESTVGMRARYWARSLPLIPGSALVYRAQPTLFNTTIRQLPPTTKPNNVIRRPFCRSEESLGHCSLHQVWGF